MRAVQLLINSYLPPDIRDPNLKMDAKSIGNLLAVVAEKYPDRYEDISKFISDVGRNASYRQGETIGLDDLKPVINREPVFKAMDKEIAAARKELGDGPEFEEARQAIWTKYSDELGKMTSTAAAEALNSLGLSVASGARGKADQLKAMLTTPGMYADHRGQPVKVFIRNSFSDGLRPAEYLAGTYSTRFSVMSTKNATAKGGDFSKQAGQAAVNLIVTEDDCGTGNGILMSPDDESLKYRVLAKSAGDLKEGSIIGRDELSAIRKYKKPVIVRSPLTCQAKQGICAKCAGAMFGNGKLSSIGDAVGITAANAIGEPITQSALNNKHSGSIVKGKRVFSGFDVINRIAQSPEDFPERAAVSEVSGIVEKIEDAPQGGKFIYVDGKQHYALPGFAPLVKPGDKVEQGDQLSDGIVDTRDIIRLRGLGEGRKHYATRLKQALDDSGMPANSVNVEMLARAAIDHVVIEDPDGLGDFLPDDVVSYNTLSTTYVPPETARKMKPLEAVGKVLQAPALHYSIGTKLTPRMAKQIEESGLDVLVDDYEPKFRPEMVRLRSASHYNPDWLAAQHTSYLKKQLNEAAIRGEDTNIEENTHFAPRLAQGVGFGKNIRITGKF